MATPTYPTLPSGTKPDGAQFAAEREDPSMSTDMEGGYVITRPKHTRTPRYTWSVAYQQLTTEDEATLQTFWNTVKGGSMIFSWAHPLTSVSYLVRFKGPIRWSYTGWGVRIRWSCSFSVEQA
jgi:hypothetical protein